MKFCHEDLKLHGQAKLKKFWLLCGARRTCHVKRLQLETCRTVTIHHLHGQDMTNIHPKDQVQREGKEFTSSGVATKLIAV